MWIEIVYGNGGTVSTVKSCHVCGMWIEMSRRTLADWLKLVMPRMWHVD